MEKALWDGQLYTTIEISDSYELEKAIRQASGRKELVCPDLDCPNPILRYCHGEKKSAYFAHLHNCNCDYAKFDKENTDFMRQVKHALFNSLKTRGHYVEIDAKIIPHHYTHILLTVDNGERIAVELGTQKTTANRIEYLSKQYANLGIKTKWIVVSDENTPAKENETFFLKRYMLNENELKDVLILNEDGTAVTQYKIDPNEYVINGCKIRSDNYKDYYCETSTLDNLTVENGELTIDGFYLRYDNWLLKKRRAFQRRKKEGEERLKRIIEQENERREQQDRARQQIIDNLLNKKTKKVAVKTQYYAKNSSVISHEERRESIMPKMNQQKEIVRDETGVRWVRCEVCGKIETESHFPLLGGVNKATLGTCRECLNKSKNNSR